MPLGWAAPPVAVHLGSELDTYGLSGGQRTSHSAQNGAVHAVTQRRQGRESQEYWAVPGLPLFPMDLREQKEGIAGKGAGGAMVSLLLFRERTVGRQKGEVMPGDVTRDKTPACTSQLCTCCARALIEGVGSLAPA